MELGRELKVTSLSYTATKFFTYDNTIKTLLEMLDQLGQILTHLNVDAFQAFRYVFLSKSLRFSQKKRPQKKSYSSLFEHDTDDTNKASQISDLPKDHQLLMMLGLRKDKSICLAPDTVWYLQRPQTKTVWLKILF